MICQMLGLLAGLAFGNVVVGRQSKATTCDFVHGIDLPSTRPLIVAHRGSSGALPEHTIASYQLGVDQGADMIECDVAVTKDLVLLCLHESWMNATTNVADLYPDRFNTYYVDDQLRMITDYFSVDFTYDEIKKVSQRQRFSFRDPNYGDQFLVASLKDYINVAQNAGRPVGIYPETKDPIFTNSILATSGTTFEDLLLDELRLFGYASSTSPCFLQSFSETSLEYMSNRTELPIIVLLNQAANITDEKLARYAKYAYGIGPEKRHLVQLNDRNQILLQTDLVERAHSVGLRVHPYTLRNEYQYLAWDYGQDPVNEYEDLFRMGIDGAFTDFPDTYGNFLNHTYYAECE